MSYSDAMEAAGAKVLSMEEFGSYQGDWWAKVRYNGEVGWANGNYGSCSGCDSFQAEFGWCDGDCEDHKYDHKNDCPACQDAAKKLQERMADFGRVYLEGLLTQEQAEKQSLQNVGWDIDAQKMHDWIKANAITKEDENEQV